MSHSSSSKTNWSGHGVKPKFSVSEDHRLGELVARYGDKCWGFISKKMRNKTAKQCRERYQNYVNPRLAHGEWTDEEDIDLISKYNEIGPKWTLLATLFNGRSVNNIRNRWLKLKRSKKYPISTFPDDKIVKGSEDAFGDNNDKLFVEQTVPQKEMFNSIPKHMDKDLDNLELFVQHQGNQDQPLDHMCFTF